MAETKEVTKNPVKAKVVALSKDGRSARVEVPTMVQHQKYGKRLHRVIAIYVDTASKKVDIGSQVSILPCRRISKTKSWKVVSVLT